MRRVRTNVVLGCWRPCSGGAGDLCIKLVTDGVGYLRAMLYIPSALRDTDLSNRLSRCAASLPLSCTDAGNSIRCGGHRGWTGASVQEFRSGPDHDSFTDHYHLSRGLDCAGGGLPLGEPDRRASCRSLTINFAAVGAINPWNRTYPRIPWLGCSRAAGSHRRFQIPRTS